MAADNRPVELNFDLVPSPQLQSKLQRQLADIERNIKFKAPFGVASREVKDFSTELDRANQRVITLGASFAVLATSLRTLKSIVSATVEVEKAFTEINAVFGLSAQGLDRFSKQLFDAARTTGQSFQKAADAAKEFSRQGLTAQETLKRTTDALILTRLANLDVAKSVETLTASINGFQRSALTSTEIINKLATVDAKFAVSSADLAEGLSRAGAAASDAGIKFDELVGLITAAQQTTARGGAVIGNAFKTIFTRVERRDTIDAMESLGVAVRDTSGNLLGALPILQNFAKVYDSLSGPIRKQAAEMVGGVYQINILKAVLGDLAKANGIVAQATGVSNNATNEAIKRNEALNKTLDSMLTKLGVSAKQIGANIGSQSFAGPLKGLLGAVQNNPITAALEDASGKAETIGGQIAEKLMQGIGGSLVFGLGPLVAKALGKVVASTGGNVFRDFKDLTGLGNQQAVIQSEINALYRAGGTALQTQLAAMSSLTDKAALLQRLLVGQNTSSPAAMTGALMGMGYRGRGRTAAGGYVPMAEEASMISAGVGGAPAGARPVYLPSFNRGGGQRGIVANTSEFIVPGAAGGAIFNRDMIRKFGLPPGATPVAAGGHIPNAAFGSMMGMPNRNGYPYNLIPSGVFGPSGGMPPYVPVGASQSATGQGFGQYVQPLPPPPVALPTIAPAASSVSSQQWSEGFAKAQKELDRRKAMEEKAAALKERQMAKMEAMLDKENALLTKRAGLSAADLKTAERYAAAIQQIYDDARGRGTALTAPIITGSRTVTEIRGIPDAPYSFDNSGIVNAGGRATSRGAAASFSPREEAVRIAAVYRQQRVEEKQTGRQASIIAQNERMASLRERLQTNATLTRERFIGQFASSPGHVVLTGPQQSAIAPSMWQRMRGGLNGQNAAMAAMFGLPFAGGMIDEGRGGTASGIGRGALGSGLSMAGFGASMGMGFGPVGAGVGAGAGLLLGGAYGALKKMEQSFEELAAEINEANSKIQRQVEFVQSAFRLQGDVIAAIQALPKDPKPHDLERIDGMRRARTQALLSIQDPKIRAQAIAKINDPNGASDIADLLLVDQRRTQSATDIKSATRRALDTGGLSRGLLGYGDGASVDISKVLLPVLSTMDPTQRAVAGRMAAIDPRRSFGMIAGATGMDPKSIADLTSRGNDNTTDLFKQAIQKAYHDLINSGIISVQETYKKGEKAAANFKNSLQELAAQLEMDSRLVQVRADAQSRVAQTAQSILLSSGGTEAERIQAGGVFNRANIQMASQASQRSQMLSARAALIRSMGKDAQGVDSEALRDQLGGLSSIEDLEKLKGFTSTDAGRFALPGVAQADFKNTLAEQIATMKLLIETEKEQVTASDELADLLMKQYQRAGTFDGASDTDRSNLSQARDNLGRAMARKDSQSDIEEAFYATITAEAAAARRAGKITDGDNNRIGLRSRLSNSRNRSQDERDAILALASEGSTLVSGSDIAGARMGNAQRAGQQGDAQGSFLGGFRSVIAGAKADLMDFSRVGQQVAETLHGAGVDAWTSWVTGAARGKDAFRSFASSVLSDASRMLASKAFSGALSAIPGFGVSSGGSLGFAAGGMVPAMLTGGEYVFGPKAAQRIGRQTLQRLNGYADGGMVRGGSGVRDDVPARLPAGSFVIRKSAAQRLGGDYLGALAAGNVQHRFLGGLLDTALGGALAGGVVGGGLGYLAGGKRGAIGGALLGAIGGGLYGHANAAQASALTPGGAAAGATLSIGAKAALMAGGAAGLGLLAGGIAGGPAAESGPISLAQVPAYRAQLEAAQNAQFAGRGSQAAYLQINPQGGYSLAGMGQSIATRRWDAGGGVDMPLTSPGGGGGSGPPQVYVKIDINNEGGVSAQSSGGEGAFGSDFAGKLEQRIRGVVQEELVNASRSDGFFMQRSRYVNRY